MLYKAALVWIDTMSQKCGVITCHNRSCDALGKKNLTGLSSSLTRVQSQRAKKATRADEELLYGVMTQPVAAPSRRIVTHGFSTVF